MSSIIRLCAFQIGAFILSMNITSCSAVDENAIKKRLEASIGQKFLESRWSLPTAAKRKTREETNISLIYEFSWANGCLYSVSVRKQDGVITDARIDSDLDLCRKVMHAPLGS
jgi:hypothetical protein